MGADDEPTESSRPRADPPSSGGASEQPRAQVSHRQLMQMALAGDNLHRLDDLEIVENPPGDSPDVDREESVQAAAPSAMSRPTPESPSTPPTTARQGAEDSPASTSPEQLAHHLATGTRWAQEPRTPLEGLLRPEDIERPPQREDEIFTLDLHGTRQAALEDNLGGALRTAEAQGKKFIRVITGRGLRSKDGYAVLKHAAALWLVRAARDGVIAFVAHEHAEEISGSFLVRLRPRTPSDS